MSLCIMVPICQRDFIQVPREIEKSKEYNGIFDKGLFSQAEDLLSKGPFSIRKHILGNKAATLAYI